ncbi:MAG TPA: hypothetical protein VMW73_03005 [Spirochaetia bacterium]|nr:hypothetical protein [Spirochaetia bacterium]
MSAEDLMERCVWPQLSPRYSEALHNAIEYVVANYSSVVGVIASGTIIRGTPDPTSDLDIYVIHTGSFRQRIQKYFKDVTAEIFVNPPLMIEKYLADECGSGRPITAHMLATGFKVLDLDPVVDRLCAHAGYLLENPPKQFGDTVYANYLIATTFEDAIDLSTRDDAAARMLLATAVENSLKQAFLLAGRYIPRPKDLIRDLSTLDSELSGLARSFYSKCEFSEHAEIGRQIVERVIGATGFFEWDSVPEVVG